MGWSGEGQASAPLGGRLKAKWEWAAVLGQVEVYGWKTLDVRCRSRPAACACVCARARKSVISVFVLQLFPRLQCSCFWFELLLLYLCCYFSAAAAVAAAAVVAARSVLVLHFAATLMLLLLALQLLCFCIMVQLCLRRFFSAAAVFCLYV